MHPEERILQHWREKLAAQPANNNALIGVVKSLALLDRVDEVMAIAQANADKPKLAEWILRVAAGALPQNPELGIAYCRLAEDAGDQAQADKRWIMLRRRQPSVPAAHLGFIDYQLRQNNLIEAERAVWGALNAVGNVPEIRDMQAKIAELQGNWMAAALRWKQIAADEPTHPEAAIRAHAAERRAAEPATATTAAAAAPTHIPPIAGQDRIEIKTLLTGFESLGYNCEFGLLQRRFGAEPLGLLRFSGTSPKTLLALLRSKFEGMGEPDKMRMSMVHGSPRLSHIYSDWTMHTPAKPGQAFDEAKLFAEQCRHATFLRKKLIKDLERQTKVMVFWKTDLTDAEIADIDAAVAAYGPNTLLCVRQGNATLAAGEHEWRSDHLMVAAIDRAGNSFPGAGWNISANYWVHFCRIAHQRWQEHRTLPAMPAVA